MLNEYLNQLKDELLNRNVEDVEEITAYITEMISDHLDNGESEEEILKSLGDPVTIAESFAGAGEKKKTEIKGLRQEFTDIRNLEIDTVSYCYEFLPSADEKLIVEYEKNEGSSLSFKRHGKRLEIEQDFSGTTPGKLLSAWFNRKVQSKLKACIYIPERFGDLELDNVSGDLLFRNVSLKEVKIDNVSGQIRMEDVAIEELKCDTVSGSYAMSDSRIEDSLDLDSVSGAIRIENLNCREVGIETVSGSVYISLWGRMNDTDIDISGLFRSEKRDGDGDASLSVSSVSGRVEYHFLED